jgi:hypothetical protein
MARRRYFRPPRNTILIICEGETEKIYFENLRTVERTPEINLKPMLPGHRTDCLSIVEQAIKQKSNYDQIWCVYDLDSAYKDRKKYKKAVEKAEKKKIETVESHPCFEIWFLLHFIYSSRRFENCKQVIQLLKKYIKDYSKNQEYHSRKNLYAELRPKLLNAINNSVRLEKYNSENVIITGSQSDMYKIIKKVLPGLKKSN